MCVFKSEEHKKPTQRYSLKIKTKDCNTKKYEKVERVHSVTANAASELGRGQWVAQYFKLPRNANLDSKYDEILSLRNEKRSRVKEG